MAEPTETRKDLRRALGRQMGMRFYRYTSEEAITSQADVVVVANFLVQRDDFWNRSWFYELANDETRMIIDSDESSKNVTLEFSPTAMGAAALFEILDFYSPKMVHEAINDAMRNAWPEFFETKEDFTLCVARDQMEYNIAALDAFMVFQVWVERPSSVERFGIVSGTTTTCILNTTNDISHLTTSHWISFYDGAGKGYSKQIATIDNGTKEITWATTAALTTALAGANNDLLLTAFARGTDGNSITLTYIDGGTGFGPGTATISVTGNAITVTIDTGVTTAAEVLAALLADSDAMALVSAAHATGNDGSGTVTAGGPWSLIGGTGTALAVAPGSDTLVSITNPTKKDEDWYPVHACDFDNKQWPDKMRFKAAYDNQFAGSRIMIRYITVPAELDTDAATTAVPIDFVLSRARAALYDWHKDDTKEDRARFDGNFTDQMIKSEAIKAAKAFQAPDQLFWTEDDPALSYANVDGDPLDWAGF